MIDKNRFPFRKTDDILYFGIKLLLQYVIIITTDMEKLENMLVN